MLLLLLLLLLGRTALALQAETHARAQQLLPCQLAEARRCSLSSRWLCSSRTAPLVLMLPLLLHCSHLEPTALDAVADHSTHHNQADAAPARRTFRKFSYRGIDLDALMDLDSEQLMAKLTARVRRKFSRGIKRKPKVLIDKLRKAKKDVPFGEKPDAVKTHLRNMIIVPEMIGGVVGIYNGKTFNQVEIKPEMVGHYLGEFSISYKPVKHGRPGIGASNSSKFVPLT